LEQFARNWNLRADEIAALQASLPMRSVGHWACSAPCWDALKQTILARLAQMHDKESDILGPDRDRLRRLALPGSERPVFAALLDELLRDACIMQSGPWLHLPEHKVRLSANEEKLWLKVRPLLTQHPFQPPRVRDIARALLLEEGKIRLLMKRVARTGQTYQVAHDHYFTREAVEALAAIVRELANTQGAASAAQFRDRIGTGRKLAIQILECFDRMGYTRRIGDAHRLRPGTTCFADHAAA
jgi:selenocysteine-specific elongation factor